MCAPHFSAANKPNIKQTKSGPCHARGGPQEAPTVLGVLFRAPEGSDWAQYRSGELWGALERSG
eukprot:11538685-Alexandrium_andersonii.AAC.1